MLGRCVAWPFGAVVRETDIFQDCSAGIIPWVPSGSFASIERDPRHVGLAPNSGRATQSSQPADQPTLRESDATATYASCGKVNLPPSSMEGVDKVAALEATAEMTA